MDSAARVLERVKAVARLALAAGVGLALLLAPPRGTPLLPLLGFVFAVYFVFAALALLFQRQMETRALRAAALLGDVAALVIVLLLVSVHSAAFLLFFLYFALRAGLGRSWVAAAALSVAVSLAYLALTWHDVSWAADAGAMGGSWLGAFSAVGGLVVAGSLVGMLAQRERRHIERQAELEQFERLLSLDTHWADVWVRWLQELCRRFRARRALLAFHDPETDRVTIWQLGWDESGASLTEDDRPPRDRRTFLLEESPLSAAANNLGRGRAGDWQLRHQFSSSVTIRKAFPLPERFLAEFSPRSLLTVPVPLGTGAQARVFLLDAEAGGFDLKQLEDLQGLVSGLVPMLTNLLTVRSLVIRSINQERDEISRALHDGVAQTLASLEMQLSVYERLASEDPAHTAEELARLRSVVKQEQESLRRFVRTLKPVRVAAKELNRWILTHCARFQQETGIEVEVEADPVDSTLPEGVCREVFQIVREALHNVHKHARAQRVKVRLQQQDSCLRLQVDDNGQGFPFAGRYEDDALRKMGMLPVSIGEHARSVGGTVSVESTPGNGTALRVEIPLE